eukprot:GHRR01034124.1.p1 GENE.GHRR01034124.1~~GHRR01034124.1.p1  ORF type:complete len:102 (-),score=20.51 GHRR01034124.1:374-679(-)
MAAYESSKLTHVRAGCSCIVQQHCCRASSGLWQLVVANAYVLVHATHSGVQQVIVGLALDCTCLLQSVVCLLRAGTVATCAGKACGQPDCQPPAAYPGRGK